MKTHIKPLSLAFFGSSDFVIPIVDEIRTHSGLLKQTALNQLSDFALKNNINTDLETAALIEQSSELDREISLAVIVSQPDRENRGKIIANPVSTFARSHNIPLFLPEKLKHEQSQFQTQYPDLDLGVTASYGQILTEQFLSWFPYGCINWHPSLLPKYRGATPMQELLKRGEAATGLSWIQMGKEMDAGDILVQTTEEIAPQTAFSNLAKRMGSVGAKTWAIAAALQILAKTGSFTPTIQNHTKATFTSKIDKEDRLVDPSRQIAQDIYNHIRAYEAFPKTAYFSSYFQEEIKITSAQKPLTQEEFSPFKITSKSSEFVQVQTDQGLKTYLICADKTYLEIQEICRANGKRINFKGVVIEEG